jgi:hypothetical protein
VPKSMRNGTCDRCGRPLPAQGTRCECGNALPASVHCRKCEVFYCRELDACPQCGGPVQRVVSTGVPSRKDYAPFFAVLAGLGAALLAVDVLIQGLSAIVRLVLAVAGVTFASRGLLELHFLQRGTAQSRGKDGNLAGSSAARGGGGGADEGGHFPEPCETVQGLLSAELGRVRTGPLRTATGQMRFPRDFVSAAALFLLFMGAFAVFELHRVWGDPLYSGSLRWILRATGAISLITVCVVGWHLWRWKRRRRRVLDILVQAAQDLRGASTLSEQERQKVAADVEKRLYEEFGAESALSE